MKRSRNTNAMETIPSVDEGSLNIVSPTTHHSSTSTEPRVSSSVVVNPFWADEEERHDLLSGQLTVRSAGPSGQATDSEMSSAPSSAAATAKKPRRPLVKQSKLQSAEDVSLAVDDVTEPGESAVVGGGGGAGVQYLKPAAGSRGQGSRQQSVESRATIGPIEDGDPLPAVFEPVPHHLYGKPLQEIDPSVKDKTFIVVSKRFRKNYIHRFSATGSFFLFSPWNPVRRFAVYLATHQYFDYVVMATILLNCIFLAMTDPVEQAEYVFLGIYTSEMVVKIVAKGFVVDRLTYLRSPWNWLDFIVILSGYVTLAVSIGNLSGLRTFRVLRALKTVSIIPGLRTIINALLKSMRQLVEVMTLIVFCLSVLALFALQVFMGELRNKCVLNWQPSQTDFTWSAWVTNDSHWLAEESGNFQLCGNLTGARPCPEGFTCLADLGLNPNYGFTNFDTFPSSMLTTFQLITLDFWENIYNMVLAACGPYTIVFFTIVVFFGSFYLINLMLAVVAMSYEEEAGLTTLESTKKLTDYREESTFSFDPARLHLILLQRGHHDSKAKAKKERRNKLAASRNQGYPQSSRNPDLPLWALARSEAHRLQHNRPNAIRSSQDIEESRIDDDVTPCEKPNDQDVIEFTFRIQEPRVEDDDGIECDSGVHTVNFASSFNTDVGYSSETSRAPSYPSSLVFKRRTFTNKSASQNYSSLTESVSSQPVETRRSESPTNDVRPVKMSCESRRLSYKRACDPDKRVSLAFDSMISEDSELSYESRSTCVPPNSNNTSSLPHFDKRKPSHGKYITEGTETDVQWLQRRKSFRAEGGENLKRDRSTRLAQVLPLSRLMLQRIVQSPWMDFFITVSIVMNTAFLAAEHHGMSPDVKHVLDVGNKVFTSVFTLECLIKIGALGSDFFHNGWNVFDFIIVLASLVDLGLEIVNGLSVLRGMRLMRVLRLAQSWTTMRVLLSIILSSLGALANLTFVLAIVVYIFAVIGMQLFGRDYNEDNFNPDPVPRWNFKDFFHAFMMIFRILCGEWVEPLWDCMRAESKQGAETCFAVFLPALVMGNFLVLNLFLALLLNSFSCEELKSRKQEIDEDSKLIEGLRKIRSIAKATRTLVTLPSIDRSDSKLHHLNLNNGLTSSETFKARSQSCDALARVAIDHQKKLRYSSCSDLHLVSSATPLKPITLHDSNIQSTSDGKAENQLPCNGRPLNMAHESRSCFEIGKNHSSALVTGLDGKISDWGTLIPAVLSAKRNARLDCTKSSSVESPGDLNNRMPDEPPDCFPAPFYNRCPRPENGTWMRIRSVLLRLVKHAAFEWMVLILIFGSSITLCFEDIYLEENAELQRILRWTNLTFALLFALEMIIKWLALGIKYYFSSVWTSLDFVVVMVSIISVAIEDTANLSALRSLRTLRALRPLRAISRWQGMRIVVNALMFAIPAIFNVLLVCLVFWLVFSILGVQLFGGKFYKCVDETGTRLPIHIVENRTECMTKNYTWVNSPIHFDHVGHAYLALFQVATFEGWMEVMADAVDIRGIDLQPSYEANLWAYLYFVVFIVCGAFFTLNLFIGVIIDNFNMLKKKYEGGVLEMFLTESQKHYYTAMKKLGRKKPRKVIRRPLNPYLALFYDISMSRRFEIAIFGLIFLNMLVMAVEHYGQPPSVTFILDLFNALFTTMFALEAIVKMIGLRHHYFTLPWNLFDLVLVSASVLGLIMEDLLTEFPVSPTLLRVVRVFRLGRVLRLVKAARGIRKLLFALIVSLPALFNIGALLALITFIYAIIGMALFGNVAHSGALNDLVNFETFGRSMLLLFRLMTAAGWNDILNSLLIQPPECDLKYNNLPNGNCGNPMLATFYLVSFIVLSSMIVINMYIAVLLENFNQAHREEELGLGEEDLERFYTKWSRFDPHATQFIAFPELSDFVASLDPPLGIPRPNMAALVTLDIPIVSGDKLHCLDILHALTRRVLGDVEDTEHFRKLQEQMDEKFKKKFPTRRQLEVVSSTAQWKQRDTAARVIQRAYHNYVKRKLEAELRKLERGDVQTQTSFPSSELSLDYDPERASLRSVLHRMSSIFHSYLGGLSRQGSRRESPSPSHSTGLSREPSTKNKPALLEVLVPSRRSSIWSLGTMVVSAQVHYESIPAISTGESKVLPAQQVDTSPDVILTFPDENASAPQRTDVIVKLTKASNESL